VSSRTTNHQIAGQSIDFSDVAAGTAIKNAATRFATTYGVPADAAFAMAVAMVDPSEARNQIDGKAPHAHLQAIQTPDGKFLLAQHAKVWTPMVSGDGGNGRSRYAIQSSTNGPTRTRPWPIARHHAPAIVDYHVASLEDMTKAVRLSAGEIRSPELVTQIARSARGVWNPPVVVIARAYVRTDNGWAERWFVHTVEGSTRVEACHELTDVDAAAPLEHSDAPLQYLRDTHKGLLERFATTPTSHKTLAAARAATMPALIVVAAVENDMVTPITGEFPVIVQDYVESVHVQPRPFSDVAQSNVIGERFVLTLESKERMTTIDAEAILGRSTKVVGKPSVRAATLVHAVCDSKNEALLRDFLIAEDGARLTKLKRAKLIGPLVVRQFNRAEDSAERALMRAFTPDRLVDSSWTVSGMRAETLRKKCLADLEAENFDTNALAELMARGGPASCAAGLLLSDQGSTVDSISQLRGGVDKVVTGLAKTAGGVNVLADAVAWADGERKERPRKFDIEGNQQFDKHKDPIHFSTAWENGNMGVRALALTEDGAIPTTPKPNKTPPAKLSPEDRYRADERRLLGYLLAGQSTLGDLVAATDSQGGKLIKKLGLIKAAVYTTLPGQLTRVYARYGNDDVLNAFDEDELPEAEDPPSDEDDDFDGDEDPPSDEEDE